MYRLGSAACAVAVLLTSAGAGANGVPAKPTYAADVAPILNANCVNCHRPGQIGPMSLRTYQEVRPWVKAIQRAVGQGEMPPWHADPEYGAFANDRSLTQREVDTILQWAKAGAPRGNPTEIPDPPEFEDDSWTLGTPDLVLEFDKVELPAGGPDRFYDLVAQTGLEEDKWVEAVEIRPSNRTVAHHVILWQSGNGGQGWLGAWAAGMQPMQFPEGTGRVLKAGTALVADMHYHPADTAQTDQTKVGLHFASDEEVEKNLVNLWIQNNGFRIPAGATNYEARAQHTFRQDAYIHGMLPHMHYRGKDFTYTAFYPDGREKILLKVNDYDFNWQTNYRFEEPVFVPEGTRIECVAHWDNSANNPDNPDPTKDVYFGNESYDEMMIGFVDYTVAEGKGLESPQDRLASLAQKLGEEPGSLYRTSLRASGNQSYNGLLHLGDASATWFMILMGTVYEAELKGLTYEGNTFQGDLTVPGVGAFETKAMIVGDGLFLGSIEAQGMHLRLRGEAVE